MVIRPLLLALASHLVVAGACAGADKPRIDDTVEPLSHAEMVSEPAAADNLRSCEPWGYCGCWQGCVEVEEVAGDTDGERRYLVLSGEYEGMRYWREHSCYPDDRPDRQCYEVCTGEGDARACADGLVQMLECTGSCVPQPADFACKMFEGVCTRID